MFADVAEDPQLFKRIITSDIAKKAESFGWKFSGELKPKRVREVSE